ncbi:MAG: M20 metallopeptidase family protein [Pleomorphochaeta sp.]
MNSIKINQNQLEYLTKTRRDLHKIPELGFNLEKTVSYILNEFDTHKIEYNVDEFNIIIVDIGKGSKTLMLRADMDALPIIEETNLEYCSTNNNMHACGHDFHTSLLISLAIILKKNEKLLKNKVRLIFQPAEETIEGAKKIVEKGYVNNINNAIMLHVFPNIEVPSGTLLIPREGYNTLSTDFFKIKIIGKGGHSAMLENTVDPIIVASHLILNLMNIGSKEVSMLNPTSISVGKMTSGTKNNIIADEAIIEGSIRSFDDKNKDFVYKRINEITKLTASMFRASSEVNIVSGCRSVYSDKQLLEQINNSLNEEKILFDYVDNYFEKGKILFGEDFSYISTIIPSAILLVAAGKKTEGFKFPLHNSKVLFDEKLLENALNALLAISFNYN